MEAPVQNTDEEVDGVSGEFLLWPSPVDLLDTPAIDGWERKLATGGNRENGGQAQGKRFSLRYLCYLLFKFYRFHDYDELRYLAARKMSSERPDQTLRSGSESTPLSS